MPTVLLSSAPSLDVDATLFIHVAVFFLLFFVLRAWVFRPAMAVFDERERAIEGARQEARALEKEAESKLEAFAAEMERVRAEANAERERLRGEGMRLERSLTEKVRQETEAMVREAEAKLALEAAAIRKQIAATSPVLARQMAEKLLGREVGR